MSTGFVSIMIHDLHVDDHDLTFESMLRFFDRKGRLRLLGHHRNGVMVCCLAP